MSLWSKDFFLEFLDIYHKNDCLWRIKSKDYYNKRKKKEGYARLLQKAHCIDPNYTEDDVKKKINNFRSSFRKEYKKVSNSAASGLEGDDKYVPKLWYYDHLLFLKDQEDQDSEPENSEAELTEESSTSALSSQSCKRQRTYSHELQEQILIPQTDNDLIVYGGDRFPSPSVQFEDDFDIAVKNIGVKLRQLERDQYVIAEKLINDVLYEAQFNNLNKNAYIVVPILPTASEVSIPNTND